MRWAAVALFSIALNVFLVVLLIGASHMGVAIFGTLKAFDVATISLASASIAVTSVGVVVALITFVGYGEIKRIAIARSVEKASEVAADVANVVATRVALDTRPSPTGDQEAKEISKAMVAEPEAGQSGD